MSSGRTWSHDQIPRGPVIATTPTTAHSGSNGSRREEINPRALERRHSVTSNDNGYNYTPYKKSVDGSSKRRSATLDQHYAQNRQHQTTANHTQHALGQTGRQYTSDLSLHRNSGAVVRGGGRSPQRVQGGGNPNQRVSFHEDQGTLHEEPHEENHTHDPHPSIRRHRHVQQHQSLPRQAYSMSECHTLDRNFRLSNGGRSAHMEVKNNPDKGEWEWYGGNGMVDDGYGHLSLPDKNEAVSAAYQQHQDQLLQQLPVGVVPPSTVIGETTPTFIQVPPTTPHTSVGVGSGSSQRLQQNSFSIPETFMGQGNPDPRFTNSHTTFSTTKVDQYNLLKRPASSHKVGNRPIPVSVPQVPPMSRPHPQQLRDPDHQEHQLRPQSQHQRGINPVRMERHGFAGGKRPPPYPQGNIVTTAMANKQLYTDTRVSPSHAQSQVSPLQYGMKPVHEAFDSVPVPVQAPTVPMDGRRWDNVGAIASSAPHNSAPQVANMASSYNPQPPLYKTGEGSQKFTSQLTQEHIESHPSVDNSFDGNDSTSAEISAYTEQMSKALEQFSLLTKRPIIQTSF